MIRTKYPRTLHLPWSESITDDDKVLPSVNVFYGKRVIVSEKMDGESFTGYSDGYTHARSLDGRSHPTRDWVKQFWAQVRAELPEGWRVCGENLYARHSIHYKSLSTYFMGFSIWNDQNICLSWDETLEWFSLLRIMPVPVLYNGIFDEMKIMKLWNPMRSKESEGYVVRLADSFKYDDFTKSVAKFVRKNHVGDSPHWMYGQAIEKNTLI